MRFELATAARIVFGGGTAAEAGPRAAELGRRPFLVTGRDPDRAAPVVAALEAAGLPVERFAAAGEPSVDTARAATAQARAAGCDLVVAVGGGSALDLGKAVAMLVANGGDPLDYIEVVGRGAPIRAPSLPLLALPTTAGTGSEVTRNAVLSVPERRVKASLRSPSMLPTLAIVDWELTRGVPPAVTAATGMDALTQLVEPLLSARANPLVDGLAREGIPRAARALPLAVRDGQDARAREDLALASLFGGLALANAGLGAAHGLAAVLGGRHDAPHGALCARLLAPVLRANHAALVARAPDHPALPRFAELARLLTGRADARPADAVAHVAGLAADLGIPPLRAWGLQPEDLEAVAAAARAASSTKANPLPLSEAELTAILAEAL
jgi:alcohol dehydrogenase class IV